MNYRLMGSAQASGTRLPGDANQAEPRELHVNNHVGRDGKSEMRRAAKSF
jgi:hypothetical protein